jgi:hypothetical protein
MPLERGAEAYAAVARGTRGRIVLGMEASGSMAP